MSAILIVKYRDVDVFYIPIGGERPHDIIGGHVIIDDTEAPLRRTITGAIGSKVVDQLSLDYPILISKGYETRNALRTGRAWATAYLYATMMARRVSKRERAWKTR